MKNRVKNIQTAGYNGACRVLGKSKLFGVLATFKVVGSERTNIGLFTEMTMLLPVGTISLLVRY